MFEKVEKLAESLWKNETLWKYSSSESKDKKIGVCDFNSNIILPLIFDEIKLSADKQIVGKINDKLYYFHINFVNDKTKAEITSAFYVDKNGQIIEDEEIFYGSRLHEMSENLWEMYSNKTKKFGVIDSFGNIIIPFEYDMIPTAVTDGQYEFIFSMKDDKFGMFDKNGNIVIPIIYEQLYPFYEDLAVAKLNGKYGFIDVHNEVKIPFIYDDVIGFPSKFHSGKAKVKLNGEIICIDKNGERV